MKVKGFKLKFIRIPSKMDIVTAGILRITPIVSEQKSCSNKKGGRNFSRMSVREENKKEGTK